MLEGAEPAAILLDGLFAPAKSVLAPDGAVAAALRPGPFERLAARTKAYASMECRMRGGDSQTACASFLVFSPAEAARELRLAGDPAAALDLLRSANPDDDESRVEAFLAASAVRLPPETDWTDAARKALAAWDRFSAAKDSLGRTGAVFCGVPWGILEDFSRARLDLKTIEPGMPLPLFLPPGQYRLSLAPQTSDQSVPSRLFEGQIDDFQPSSDAERPTFTARLDVQRPALLRLTRELPDTSPRPFPASLEIAWSSAERIAETAQTLRRVLESHPPRTGF